MIILFSLIHSLIHLFTWSVDISAFFTTPLDPSFPSSLPSSDHCHKVQQLRAKLDEIQNKGGLLAQHTSSKQNEEESQLRGDDILSQLEKAQFYAPNCQNPDLIYKLKRLDDLRYSDMISERVETGEDEEEGNSCTSLSLLAMQQYYFYWGICLMMCGDFER